MNTSGRTKSSTLKAPSRRMEIFRYFCVYTLIFCIIMAVAFFPFLRSSTSLVWKIDGLPQYMLWLQYTGEYLRDFFTNLFHGNFTLPMYDFSIGLGGDVRTFFKTEPVALLGAFHAGEQYTWEFYSLLTVLRIYLIGIAFSCYGFFMKKSRSSILAGTILYTFSSYTFYHVVRHPQFCVGIMMLPLLLIGLEQVMRRKNVLFFVLMVAVSLFSSYYFLFMNTLIMVLYAILRFGDIYETHRVREFFKMVGRIIASYLFGCGISVVFFAPSIASFFLSARSGSGGSGAAAAASSAVGSLLHYGASHIVQLFLTLLAPVRETTAITTISVSALILPALVLFFSGSFRKKLSLKLGLLFSLLFLMVPVFGYIFSGFSTVNNRWTFAFIFLLAVVMMLEFDQIRTITKRQYAVLAGLTVLYGICWLAVSPHKKAYAFAFVILAAIVILIGVFRRFFTLSPRAWRCALIGVLCVTVAASGYFMYNGANGNLIDQFASASSVNSYFSGSRYQHLANIEDDSFYRTDTNMMYNNYNNTAVALGYNGVSQYSSTIGSDVISYFIESESTGISAVNRTLSMDNRAAQEALADVKYFITERGNDSSVPYGYEKDDALSANSNYYDIYVNQNMLSIGYTYDSLMPLSEYEGLSALEKQQVQLKQAVVDDDVTKDFSELSADGASSYTDGSGISAGDFRITGVDKGIKQDGNVFTCKKKYKTETVEENGQEKEIDISPKVHFTTASKAGCEVYLRLSDVDCSLKSRTDINVYTDDGIDKRAILRSDEDTYTLGRDDYLINLGYYDEEKPIDGEISFTAKGDYTIGDFAVYYVSMDDYEASIADRNAESLKDVQISTNTVSGTVTTSGEKFMAFSIPWHIGWTAYVDGEKVKTYKVNTMYMGIRLEAGTHELVLRYTSPGIRAGAVVSVICLAGFFVGVVLWRRKKKRVKKV